MTSITTARDISPWFPFGQHAAQARMRLFCLPYGGGGAWIYRHLAGLIPHDVEVCPIELPGRATRAHEAPCTHTPHLVAGIAEAMRPLLDLPYAIFGYSLGALLAFEVTRKLRRDGQPLPSHIFVAARRPPHVPLPDTNRSKHSDDELIEELQRLGGTPKAVLDNAELLQLLLPCLRADFSIDQTYTYEEEPPLACSLITLGGEKDAAVPQDSLEEWRLHTTGPCRTHLYPGGHFFLEHNTPQIASLIHTTLRSHDFWQRYLEGCPPLLTLPTDRKRPSRQTNDRGHVRFPISQDHTTALRTLGKNAEASLSMTALSIYALLLYRHTGQAELVVGSFLEDNHLADILTLRISIDPAACFRSLLDNTRQSVLNALAHKDMPFSEVVDTHKTPRDQSYHPVFQVSFALNRKQAETETRLHKVNSSTAKLDISLNFVEGEDGLAGSIEYSTDLFDAATIERMAGHYQTLVDAVLADPECPLGSLEMLTKAEREALLHGIHPQPPLVIARCVHAEIAAQVERTPHAPALSVGTQTLTYTALAERVAPLAAQLAAMGVGPDVLVGVHLPRSANLVVAVLAVLTAGGAYLPLDPGYPAERTALIVEDAAPSVILTTRALAAGLNHNRLVLLDELQIQPSFPTQERPAIPTTPHHLAYVLYTSGSTGRPQGVEIEHRQVASFFGAMDELFGASRSGVWLAVTSLSFDISVLELLWTLSRGLHVVLQAELQLENTATASDAQDESFASQIMRHGVTHLQCTPSLARLLVSDPQARQALRMLREFLVGGEELPQSLARDLADLIPGAVRNMYGPTETTVWSTSYRVPKGCSAVHIGSPLANSRVYVLDANDNLAPIGVTGEIVLGGASVARGYRGRPELTARRFIADPFVPGARMYRTGDLGRMRPDGTLDFLGRRDSQIKLRGHRVELGDVEAALRKSSLVAEAAVAVHPDAAGEPALCAYVVPADSGAIEVVHEAPAEHLSTWQALWERTYGQPRKANEDARFWTAGWISSDTGEAIAAEAMREWVDTTVERIRSSRPSRVLEIGCGSGLLLFRLAPHCEGYIAQDFSAAAIKHVQAEAACGGLTQVLAVEAPADELSHVPPRSVDTVVINSVIQYFPSAGYLFTVLERAVERVRDGGTIFLGDMRDLRLLAAQLASALVNRTDAGRALHAELTRRVAEEEELLLDPAFFAALPARLERVQEVRILRKQNRHNTEMARFRYDVFLYIGAATQPGYGAMDALTWADLTLATLRPLLTSLTSSGSAPLVFRDVPDAALSGPASLAQALGEASADNANAADLLAAARAAESAAFEMEAMRRIAEDLGLQVDVSPPISGALGMSDIVFWSPSASAAPSCWSHSSGWKSPNEFTNNPLRAKQIRTLVPRLREHLQRHLPDFMLPSAFVLLDELPRTPNGKIARRALPVPQRPPEDRGRSYVAPITQTEIRLAELWSHVLGIERPGINDNFFDLGGHSFSAVQLALQIRGSFGRELPLSALFATPSLSGMAKAIE